MSRTCCSTIILAMACTPVRSTGPAPKRYRSARSYGAAVSATASSDGQTTLVTNSHHTSHNPDRELQSEKQRAIGAAKSAVECDLCQQPTERLIRLIDYDVEHCDGHIILFHAGSGTARGAATGIRSESPSPTSSRCVSRHRSRALPG